jgi:hypothetical protein
MAAFKLGQFLPYGLSDAAFHHQRVGWAAREIGLDDTPPEVDR